MRWQVVKGFWTYVFAGGISMGEVRWTGEFWEGWNIAGAKPYSVGLFSTMDSAQKAVEGLFKDQAQTA